MVEVPLLNPTNAKVGDVKIGADARLPLTRNRENINPQLVGVSAIF